MFKLKLLRTVVVGGRRWLPGAEVQADAQTACDLVEAGTARLLDDADLARLVELVGARRLPMDPNRGLRR